MSFFREHTEFFRQFREQFESTGAIAPSSQFLARAMARPFGQRPGPARILEVGPGTGAVTRRLVRMLRPGDWFDLVELNSRFVEILQRRFEQEPGFREASGQCRLHQAAIQSFPTDQPYDYIISGLPLNNFPPELVQDIFKTLFQLLKPGGTLSYFEYMYVRPLRRAVSKSGERKRLRDLDVIIAPYLKQHRIRRDWVFGNLPPAWVQHLRAESGT